MLVFGPHVVFMLLSLTPMLSGSGNRQTISASKEYFFTKNQVKIRYIWTLNYVKLYNLPKHFEIYDM